MLGGLKTVFRGLCFTPKLPLNPISTSSLTWCLLGAVLATAIVLTSLTWCSLNRIVLTLIVLKKDQLKKILMNTPSIKPLFNTTTQFNLGQSSSL